MRGENAADAVLAGVGGLLLTGGADVSPERYGAVRHPRLGPVSDERDEWELALIAAAKRRNLPLLAICRGAQILNVALGGTLVQDIPSERPSPIDHDPRADRSTRTHPVEIDSDSKLARAIGAMRIDVNSLHHQAIDRAGDDLRVVATAPDGIIEGVESARESDWWCVGVQWHPEDLDHAPESWDRSLFGAFANAVRERNSR